MRIANQCSNARRGESLRRDDRDEEVCSVIKWVRSSCGPEGHVATLLFRLPSSGNPEDVCSNYVSEEKHQKHHQKVQYSKLAKYAQHSRSMNEPVDRGKRGKEGGHWGCVYGIDGPQRLARAFKAANNPVCLRNLDKTCFHRKPFQNPDRSPLHVDAKKSAKKRSPSFLC